MASKQSATASKITKKFSVSANTIRHEYSTQDGTHEHRICTTALCSSLCATLGAPRDTRSIHLLCRRYRSTSPVGNYGALVRCPWSRVLLGGVRYRSTCLSNLSEDVPRNPRLPWVTLLRAEANQARLRCTATLCREGVLPRVQKADSSAKSRLAVWWQSLLCYFLGFW